MGGLNNEPMDIMWGGLNNELMDIMWGGGGVSK